jgi:hypothetical protein
MPLWVKDQGVWKPIAGGGPVQFGFNAPEKMDKDFSDYCLMTGVTVNSSGLFVACGYNTTGNPLFSTSNDGVNWTTIKKIDPDPAINVQLNSISVNNSGRFVAIGDCKTPQNLYPLATTSTDGINWSIPAKLNGSTTTNYIRKIAVNNSGLFVGVGSDNTVGNLRPVYTVSADGINWSTPQVMNGTSKECVMFGVTVNSSGLFVAIGFLGDATSAPLFSTSTNGTDWTTPTNINGYTDYATMGPVAVNKNGLFVAVGENRYDQFIYSVSSDGNNWSTPSQISGFTDRFIPTDITVNDSGRFVVIGEFQQLGAAGFTTSFDGVTWTIPETLGGSTNLVKMRSLIANKSGRFVAVGYGNSEYYGVKKPIYAISNI